MARAGSGPDGCAGRVHHLGGLAPERNGYEVRGVVIGPAASANARLPVPRRRTSRRPPRLAKPAQPRHRLHLMFLAAMAAARRSIGPLRKDAMGRRLIQRADGEVAAVARAAGIAIADDEEALTLRALDSVPYDMKPSFLIDVERGGLNELDALSGAVARLGEELGVPTLVHDTVVAALGGTGGTAEEQE